MVDPVNVRDFVELARANLDPETWDYVEGGSGDEHTLHDNEDAWADLRLAPHVAVDVTRIDTSRTVLGHELVHPILLAPTAAHDRYHPGGEHETLRGAAAAETIASISTLGSTRFKDLAGSEGRWWMQLYVQRDRGFTRDLVDQAVTAGASAVLVTVDLPVPGPRDRDRRVGGQTINALRTPNLDGITLDLQEDVSPHRRVRGAYGDPGLDWDDVAEICTWTTVPVLVKGVLRPDDAVRAVDAGVAGVIVSNHGARALDTVPPTAAALPRVAEAVDDRVPLLVDGGIRRGTDVAKALCLGASAVLIGRPYVWGLAAAGAAGVTTVVEMLRAELEMAMSALGATTLAELTPDLLWDDPRVTP